MKGKFNILLASINGGAAVVLAHLIDQGILSITGLMFVAINLFAVAFNIFICAKINLEAGQ